MTSSPTPTPTGAPTQAPRSAPTDTPTSAPTQLPTTALTNAPSPTSLPTASPTIAHTLLPTTASTPTPTAAPTPTPTAAPGPTLTAAPTKTPAFAPTKIPTREYEMVLTMHFGIESFGIENFNNAKGKFEAGLATTVGVAASQVSMVATETERRKLESGLLVVASVNLGEKEADDVTKAAKGPNFATEFVAALEDEGLTTVKIDQISAPTVEVEVTDGVDTESPTKFPTPPPTAYPIKAPTKTPTKTPTTNPTAYAPTSHPTVAPTDVVDATPNDDLQSRSQKPGKSKAKSVVLQDSVPQPPGNDQLDVPVVIISCVVAVVITLVGIAVAVHLKKPKTSKNVKVDLSSSDPVSLASVASGLERVAESNDGFDNIYP